ncbi:aromatic acid exporter family protein [Paenibacillus sp. alder61]|uniref:Aromatic acid exporter family protein n=1 Tax=Paenibacillus faecis TaxID=862114 RepID=A0A5D0CWS9_9BACL|nr:MULTISPECIES: aromatic acid exporter family protein [Paenibacillus]MCA1294285.1 aromatic acid exporter family protein [Paenibacillus sp. alder61]TYA14412.1 aromatic acid exporter family protein [Paenibacillus faecis]
MTFGARMLKTGLAVTLALYVVSWLNLSSPVIAAVASIFAMQPTIYRSWRYLLDQLQTNTLGAVLAMLGGMLFSNEPIAVGLVCILVIMICLKLNMGETIGITLVTVVSVMEASGQWEFALNRFALSLIGIVSAFVINVLVMPPKPKVQYLNQIQETFHQLSLLLRTAVSDEMKETVFRSEKRKLEDKINSLNDKFKLMEEDQKKLKTPKFSDSRQLVVYKQMLKALRKGYGVLDAVEQHYFQAVVRTPEMNREFDQQLEKLIKFHEHIMLKFDDKLKPNNREAEEFERENDEFLRRMLDRYASERVGVLRLSIVSAEMYEYGHQLERLNRLADHRHTAGDS